MTEVPQLQGAVAGAMPHAGDPDPSVLRAAARRFAQLRLRARAGIWTEAAGFLCVLLVGFAVLSYGIDRTLRLELLFRAALLLVLAVAAGRVLLRRLVRPLSLRIDDDELALAVERQDPSLRQALISAMQFERALGGHERVVESRTLMRAVVADVQGRFHDLPLAAALDGQRIRRHAGLAAFGLAAFAGWGIVDGEGLWLWARRNLALSSVEWPRYTKLHIAADPDGTIRLPQGDPLTVRVTVAGPKPDQVFLRTRFQSGDEGVEPMSRTGDGEYALTLETVLEDATLVAEGGDGVSDAVPVQILQRPRIEEVVVQVLFPAYMAKEPETVPVTEGELRLLRGSEVRLAARSHKPLAEAFLLLGDEKHALQLAADKQSFHGQIAPKTGGLLVVDVIDENQLGAATPPKLLVRLVDDKAPTIDFKLRGISSLVTPQVRIPGEIKIRDDFGVTSVTAAWRAVDDAPERQPQRQPDDPPPVEAPFVPIEVAFGEALPAGAVRYETAAVVDIKPLARNPERDDDPQNLVRPGMLLSLRFLARDNFGPGEPHEAQGETLSFRVVTRDKLVDELRRRQVEQRQEVERIRDDEQQALLSLRETINPAANDARAAQARLQFKTLAARQQALGRRVGHAADLYQRILWEYENNRIWEPSKVREYEGLTAVPLAALAKEAFPTTAHAVATFADGGDEELRATAVGGYTDILSRLDAIIKVMEQVETLAALIEQLRGVIKVEDEAIREVERRLKEAGERVFGDRPGKDPKKK